MEHKIDEKLWERAELFAAQPFEISVFEDTLTDGTHVFVATNPELPGCKAHGNTKEEAETNLLEVKKDFIYFLLKDGLSIPSPRMNVKATSGATFKTVSSVVSAFTFASGVRNIDNLPAGGVTRSGHPDVNVTILT